MIDIDGEFGAIELKDGIYVRVSRFIAIQLCLKSPTYFKYNRYIDSDDNKKIFAYELYYDYNV